MAVKIEKIDSWRWRIPRHGTMRSEGLIFADETMMAALSREQALEQVANVATLPGIVGPSIGMPDIHWGYGFPIGGVAAFDPAAGVVSPGGVGYDINCGVRLMRTRLEAGAIHSRRELLANRLFQNIPSGVGSHRRDLKLSRREELQVLKKGARWAVENGYGTSEDLEKIEENGTLGDNDPLLISDRALERGRDQLGTLGSGNHFIEVGKVVEVYDEAAAAVFGLAENQVTVTVHTGSRGLGHQVCNDYLKVMLRASREYGIDLPDKQLCCAPLASPQGEEYLSAMACAANFAFASRQLITSWVRETFQEVFGAGPAALGMALVYDICHNIAKWETHHYQGEKRRLCVHRKGATRAFPPGHPQIPSAYRLVGQPVLIPGDMGRYSFVLAGTREGYEQTFGSCCHGAGRVLSRHAAKKAARGRRIAEQMEQNRILVRAAGRATLAEEIPEAYKDVAEVVEVVHHAGIGRKVAKLCPLIVIKG
jgi:tRNA-splicing ligase RtcB